jgi:competence protein ComEC
LRKTAFCVLLLLSCYAFFIGNAPSVQRAWLSISLFLIGQLFNWRISALNALGAGLTLAILINPSIICHIGFQLSFLCTLAILLLYPFSHALCSLLLPKRSLSIAASMPRLHQHGYVFCSFIREALSLNLAVHLVTLPVILHLFHSMPLLSLVYNLFFPFWVSLSLLLLLVSVPLTALIPPLGAALHALNSAYTGSLLELTAHPPALFNFCVRVSAFPFSLAVILIGGVFFLAILQRCTEQDLNL